MLNTLELENVGPSNNLRADFASRLNLITGDNGLGKSFLLDIAWWALTRRWPRELNRGLTSGEMARPTDPKKKSSIAFSVSAKTRNVEYVSSFSPADQAWTGRAGRPLNPGLVLYAMADGSFAAWDPARNYWGKKGGLDVQERIPAYVFGPRDIWDGLIDAERGLLCNGLISDWTSWQKEKGESFSQLCTVLERLSAAEGERLRPGPYTRISLDDPRDIPTLIMPYGFTVPVPHVSAGIRRVLSLAYLLVWSWQEHQKASFILGQETTSQMVFLIDEIESHLHPRWQRSIVRTLLDVMGALAPQATVQLILATHSPLVMASVEPIFDQTVDAWFDLDLQVEGAMKAPLVEFHQRPFLRLGEVSRWLMSDAFDLKSARSLEAERLLEEASHALANEAFSKAEAKALHQRLVAVLGDTDPFWMRWRHIGQAKGWWPDPTGHSTSQETASA